MSKKKKQPSVLKKLQPFLGKRKLFIYSSMVMSILAALFGLVPYGIVYLFSVEILERPADNPNIFILYAGIAFLAIILKGICYKLSSDFAHQAAFDILYDIRIALAEKLTKLPLGYFDTHDTGKIKVTMNEDVEQLEEGIAHLIPDITTGVSIPLLTFLAMFILDWRMAMAALLIIPLLGLFYANVMKKMKPLVPKQIEVGGLITNAVLRYVYGMKVIRVFSQSEKAFEEYATVVKKAADLSVEIEKETLEGKTIFAAVAQMPLLIVIPMGVWLYSAGEISLSLFVLFIMLTIGIGNTLVKAFRSNGQVSFRLAGVTRKITAMLDEPELTQPTQAVQPQEATITFENVSFAYNEERDVLRNVTFTVPEGTLTALVGESGAGKTTIARLVPRFWDATSGQVSIGGVDVRNIGSQDLMNFVSYVFQDVYLFEGTIMDNIRMGRPEATDEEVIAAAKQAYCHHFIMQLEDGYQTVVGDGGGKLSGGQRQRISIVRAFLKQAPILVLDEATALIDAENEAYIQDAINELMHPINGQPKTIIMIAHRLHTIVKADQILVIEDGQIAAKGTHQELLATHASYQTQWEAYRGEGNALLSKVETTAKPLPFKAKLLTKISEENKIEDEAYRHLSEYSVYKQSLVVAGSSENKKELKEGYRRTFIESFFISIPLIVVAYIVYLLFTDSVTDVWKVVGGMFLALLLQGLTYYYSNRIMFLIYYKMTASIRLYLGRRLKNLPLGYFSKQDAALLEMNVKQDAMFLGFTPAIVIGIIKGVITPVMTLLVLAWIDWTLALIAIAGIPMCLFITKLADQQLQKVMNRLQTARKQANRRILDFIRGISVIRSFGLAGSKLLGYQETMDEFRKSSIQLNKKLSPYTALNVIMFEIGYVIVLVVSGLKYTAGTIDGVSLICFLILTAALYETLPIMDYVVYKRLMKTTLDSLDDVIQEEDLLQPEIGQEKLPATFGVTLENISFGYTNQEILHKLNLTIPENGITALVGPSGGGKTTTLNLIARFYDIASGSIKIGNVDIRDMRHDTLMQHISFVFQDVYLMPDTIMNNLKFGNPHASFEEVVAAAKLACCHEFIMEFPEGYDTQISDGGANLSGGQKQRISIARALLKDAPIVLLDEATASVDPENELYIREALQVLAQHKTVIMVAHRLHTIRNATKIAVIEDGNVVESGSHEELFTKNGRYKQFWQERQRAEQWQVEI